MFDRSKLEDCYWAGFIAADGCVCSRPGGRQDVFQIELHDKDVNHLKDLAIFLDFNGNYYYSRGCTSFRIASNALAIELEIKFNITKRKTTTLQPPNIKFKRGRLAFIKGFIDGDGCIYTKEGRRDNPTLRIFGGSKDILIWIHDEIERTIQKQIPALRDEPNGNYSLNVSGKKAQQFLEILDSMDTPHLERKWSKLQCLNS